MRVGLIARSNEKGLGYQTWSFAQNYPVASILHVTDANRRAPEDISRYPQAFHTLWHPDRGFKHDDAVEAFLDEIDVIFSVETLYDWELANRKPTVVQGNPEFYRHHQQKRLPRPTVWTWPTPWKTDVMPEGPVVPVPVPSDGWALASPPEAEPFTIVHVAGHRANGDRNGTELFVNSLSSLHGNTLVRIYAQDGDVPDLPRVSDGVEVEVHAYGVIDRWSMYADAHVLVMPRRYGGLCLPVLEALASGVAVVMTDCSPNPVSWPIIPLRSDRGKVVAVPFGPIRTHSVHPKVIAMTLNRLKLERPKLYEQMAESAKWAKTHSWDALRPQYDALFEKAAS